MKQNEISIFKVDFDVNGGCGDNGGDVGSGVEE